MNGNGLRGLASLACVSAASIGFEIALTRFFAVTNWAEFGYWVISSAMLGIAAAGVALSLLPPGLAERKWAGLAAPSCVLLMLTLAAGFTSLSRHPLNPLEFQHPDLAWGQVLRVGAVYLWLFPYGFLTGAWVGAFFLSAGTGLGAAYAADLGGAAAGAVLLLALMWVCPHAWLSVSLPPLLWAAGMLANRDGGPARRRAVAAALTAGLVAAEAWMALRLRPGPGEFKPVFAALNAADVKVAGGARSPRGEYLLLDDWLERTEPDLSNNLARTGRAGPPRGTGLYRDGDRVTALPARPVAGFGYASAALESLPYRLVNRPRVLLIGTRGGFRIPEARSSGARELAAVEPDPVVREFVASRLADLGEGGFPLRGGAARRTFLANLGGFDVVDIASDFADQAEAHRDLFTVEGLREALAALAPGGCLSIPVSIRESVAEAVRAAATAAEAAGPGAESRIAVVRSAWAARILVLPGGIGPASAVSIARFMGEWSFDPGWMPGGVPREYRPWNELPPTAGDAELGGDDPRDALRGALNGLLGKGAAAPAGTPFDLSPATRDRPWLVHVIKPFRIWRALPWLAELPESEMALFVNAAVLLQAALCALPVLLLPFLLGRGRGGGEPGFAALSALYFTCLGLGFMFVEIALIEVFTLLLDDRAAAFSLVLFGLLAGAGAGSWWSGRFTAGAGKAARCAAIAVAAGLAAAAVVLPRLAAAGGDWPAAVRWSAVIAALGPVSFGMGMLFPLALGRLTGSRHSLLPWAFAVNGTCSVIATPLAALMAIAFGLHWVFMAAAGCYLLAAASFPPAESAS